MRELRATLNTLHMQVFNHGASTEVGRLCSRTYDHMAWLLDAFLFDVDDQDDCGGRS